MQALTNIIDSRVECVDDAEAAIRQFAGEAGFEESDQYFIGLAAREIIINAMKHGNRFDRNKKVGISLKSDGVTFAIEVNDEGDGFKLGDVPNPKLAENLERRSGRGLTMALAIMDEFAVQKGHPTGTRVLLAKRLPASGK